MSVAGHHGRRPACAAARGLLVLALSAAACSAPADRPRPPSSTSPLVGVQPSGEVSLPITFTWTGNSDDAVVRVSVEDRARRPVFDFESRGSSAAAPGGLVDALTPGERFTWTVAVVDENGAVSRTSAPVEFTRTRQPAGGVGVEPGSTSLEALGQAVPAARLQTTSSLAYFALSVF